MIGTITATQQQAGKHSRGTSNLIRLPLPTCAYYLLFMGLTHNYFSCCHAFAAIGIGRRSLLVKKTSSLLSSSRLRLSNRSLLLSGASSFRYTRARWGTTNVSYPRDEVLRNGNIGQYATSKSLSEEVVETTVTFSNSNHDDEITTTPISASKWELATICDSDDGTDTNLIRNLLVCGDGDLSYCAEIAPELNNLGIELVATVLEEEEIHNQVYQYSKSNTDIIQTSNQKPMFGIDATQLSSSFGTTKQEQFFDRITFNFPHWRGKANNRYNRQLLSEFLESARTVLSPRGEIHVALCGGQGGCSATSLQEWRGSWTASMYAAEHGLLLARVFPYNPEYNLSSHRGVDRPFSLGKDPKLHVFVKPNNGITKAPRDIQLCCRHELHVVIPDNEEDVGDSTICSLDQVLAGDAIETIIQSTCVPDGIRVEVPARQILELTESHQGHNGISSTRVAVFLVVYCGEGFPVTRSMADTWRENTEAEVGKYIPLRENRRGRTVSKPFPYPALHPEIKYHTTGKKQ